MLNQQSSSRLNSILLLVVLSSVVLYFGKEILIILFFSAFFAMLMTPVSKRLEKWGISRTISALISVFIIVIVIALVLYIVIAQIAAFSEDLPKILSKTEEYISVLKSKIESQFGISYEKQAESINEQLNNSVGKIGSFFTGMLKSIGAATGGLLIIIVFTFLFILQRDKYEEFVLKLVSKEERPETKKVLGNIANVAQQYLKGRAVSIVLLDIFYSIGFLVLGLENGLLLAAIAAILTFIPYVGPILGGLLPVFMALVTEDSPGVALGVIIVLLIAQAIDNYFIEPMVVGGSVNISPFFTIFILIVGGIFWGVAGVILFLPMLAILKIIFEHIEGLQSYAFLIGDEKKTSSKKNLWDRIKGVFK